MSAKSAGALARKKLYNNNRRFLMPWAVRYGRLRERSISSGFSVAMTRSDFYEWFKGTEKKCSYCDLTDLTLDSVHIGGTLKNFTVDRINNDLPYQLGNICFACWRCNRAKSNLFSASDFREIAQKYIKPKWLRKAAETIQ